MIKVIATGDSLFTADFPKEYQSKRKQLDEFIAGADVKITNLETNLSDFGDFANQYSGGTWLNTRKELFKYLKTYGFNFYGTANNHCMDYSYAGLLSTIETLNKKGYAHAGTGKSLGDAEKPAVLTLESGETTAVFAVDTSMELPSMAGRASKAFKARAGVNYLRHETAYTVSEKDLSELKRIARETGINFTRDKEIASGYILPDKDGTFTFGGTVFTTGKTLPKTKCNAKDLKRLTDNILKAKDEYDYAFILVHCHDDDGVSGSNPPEYLKEFCRAAINAGASAV